MVVRMFSLQALARWVIERDSGRAAIIMMHRFAEDGGHHGGHSADDLRSALALLRKAGASLMSVDDAIKLLNGEGIQPGERETTVIFTVDDGYADVASVALPVFREFDCPVTTFVAPDVVSGNTWYWWDKLDYCSRHSNRKSITVNSPDAAQTFSFLTEFDRRKTMRAWHEMLRHSPPDDALAFVDMIASACEVNPPSKAPADYRCLSWDEMRSLESDTIRFGAHTMTHPVLSQCSDERARSEIVTAMAQVRDQLTLPSEVFCYPVGTDSDYGEREIELVKETGAAAALSAVPGLIGNDMRSRYGESWKYRLPRMSFDGRRGALIRQFL